MQSELTLSENSLDKLPPQSIEAEQAVLGALLVNGEAISRVADIVRHEYFYRKAHQVIYAAMLDLFEKGEPIDIVTISQYLKDAGTIDNIGGRQYLTDLAMSVATTANVEYYAKVVHEKSLVRNLIRAGTEIVQSCYEDSEAAILIDNAERLIFSLAEQREMKQLVHIRDIVEVSFARIEERYENRDSLSGTPSGFYDLDALTSGFQPSDLIIVAARPSMGKCLAFDSEIVLSDGRVDTIENIYKQQTASLLTLKEDWKLTWTEPSCYVDDGIKPVFRVTTRLGRSIETTITHPFLTAAGWKRLGEISVGEEIATPRTIPVMGRHRMRDCEVKLLAYFIGDGSLSVGNPRFTNTNRRIQDDFSTAVREFGAVDTSTSDSRGTRAPSFRVRTNRKLVSANRRKFANALTETIRAKRLRGADLAAIPGTSVSAIDMWKSGACAPSARRFAALCSALNMKPEALSPQGHSAISLRGTNGLTEWLDRAGLLGKTAQSKFVPAEIFSLERAQLALFLNRLFSTDGWATRLASGQPQLGYATVSERLARQVQHLLLRFGVIAKLRKRSVKYKGGLKLCWQLDITDRFSITTFIQEIGIFGKERALLDVDKALQDRDHHPARDLIPMKFWDDLESAKLNESWNSLAKRCDIKGYTNIHVRKRHLTRGKLLKLAGALSNERLVRLASSDIYWDEIVSIEPMGAKQVYDLTIPETHNFIANDICVHNTALCLSFAQHAAVELNVPVAIFSLEMSREQLVQRMLCSLAEIDATRLRTGYLQNNDWNRLAMAMGRLGEAPIFIDDSAVTTALDIRAKCRRLKAEQKALGLIVIDYIQLMQGRKVTDNRQQEVSEISRSLKTLARELEVPVIALSQLSRAVESRQSKKPMLSDLRESGCLAGETRVFLPDEGVYRRIDSLVGQSGFHVLALNETTWKLERRPVTHAFSTGRKPVHKLSTRLNRTIRATANHKFLTIDGWKRLDELAPGMCIAIPRHLQDRDLISQESWPTVGPATQDAGLTSRQMQVGMPTARCSTAVYEHTISRERAARVATIVNSDELSRLSDSDVYWDEVVEIVPDGESEVYDLTVDGLHNFVAENITVHNSIEQDADIVMFIYRDEYYNQESERRGEADIIIAKQRNGPVGEVQLLFQSSITRFLNKVHTSQGYSPA